MWKIKFKTKKKAWKMNLLALKNQLIKSIKINPLSIKI